jgi:hypothetical protein
MWEEQQKEKDCREGEGIHSPACTPPPHTPRTSSLRAFPWRWTLRSDIPCQMLPAGGERGGREGRGGSDSEGRGRKVREGREALGGKGG